MTEVKRALIGGGSRDEVSSSSIHPGKTKVTTNG